MASGASRVSPIAALDAVARRLWTRFTSRYWAVLVAGQALSWVPIAVLWFVLIGPYFDASRSQVLVVVAVATGFTIVAAIVAAVRALPAFRVIAAWCQAESPDADQTTDAWDLATTSAYQQYRRDAVLVNAIAVLPSCLFAARTWDVSLAGTVAMLAACVIPAAFATVLGYGVLEILMRPLVAELAAALDNDHEFVGRGLPLRRRIRVTVLVFTSSASLAGVSLLSEGSGPGQLSLAVAVSLAVGLGVSGWLDLILSHGITEPIETLRRGIEEVRSGDFAVRLPLVASDELGELALAFNQMVDGLRERDRLRDVFATYMDKEVARIVLEDQIPVNGFEIDVSIIFCDVRGFTAYAEGASPSDVIASLNLVFSAIVPVVERYGGHVDKFIGDGMLAIFGAPEEYADHADRALAAALEIAVNARATPTALSVGVGINSGSIVAGTVGGGGRLNFTVVGDAVNVAARVEAATRQTGDDVLLTSATRQALTRPALLVPRGAIQLKGKADPVALFAATVSV